MVARGGAWVPQARASLTGESHDEAGPVAGRIGAGRHASTELFGQHVDDLHAQAAHALSRIKAIRQSLTLIANDQFAAGLNWLVC